MNSGGKPSEEEVKMMEDVIKGGKVVQQIGQEAENTTTLAIQEEAEVSVNESQKDQVPTADLTLLPCQL